jgi:hypothetical protein
VSYQIAIVSRAEREARIKKGLLAPVGELEFHDFRNAPITLPEIKLGIEVPVYRMENYRTFTDQREHILKEGLPPAYFTIGQEVESVQQVQHNLLATLARRGVADSVVPVIDVLEREKQREPILITSSGVVVNGNRRLAAMRELLSKEPSFSHVRCAVLPEDTTGDDILNIEAALQAKPETKLDYDWIGDAQLVSRLVTLHKGTAEVARRLDRSEKEIKNAMLALAEADLYLKEWVNAEGAYSKVREDAEQLFKDLPKQLEGKDPALRRASRAIAWTLFDNKDKLPGRVYSFNPAFGKLAAEVLDKVASDLGLPTEIEAPDEEDGGFAVDVGGDDAPISYDAVVDALKAERDEAAKSDKDETAVDALIEAAQNAVEFARGQKSGLAALKAVQQAHAKLMAVDVQRAAAETRAPMRKQLEAVAQLTAALVKKLDTYENT